MTTRRPRQSAIRARLAALARAPDTVTLRVEGDVDADMAKRIKAALLAAPKAKAVSLLVNSRGGDLASAFQIYDAIRAHAAPLKRAAGVGDVASAAALIFLAADVRRLYPSARVLLHGSEVEPRPRHRWTKVAYAETASTLALLDDAVCDTIVERTGARQAIIAAELSDERPMPLPKALSIGFAHEVVGVSPPLDPAWPLKARAVMRTNIGAAIGYRFAPTYINACRRLKR